MKIIIWLISIITLFVFPSPVFSESTYVLPYPSFMPGHIFYKPAVLVSNIEQFWHFGTFSQFKYNLELSNKYLVESEILFEYKQYFFATKALEKSTNHFKNLKALLMKAQIEGKPVQDKKILLVQAAQKHIEVLTKLKQITPLDFEWTEENTMSSHLLIHQLINEGILQRKEIL